MCFSVFLPFVTSTIVEICLYFEPANKFTCDFSEGLAAQADQNFRCTIVALLEAKNPNLLQEDSKG